MVVESVGFVEFDDKVFAGLGCLEDFAENGSRVNGGELERVAKNKEASAFGNGFEECCEHFNVDHARFIDDEDGVGRKFFVAVECEVAFAF